MCSNNYAVASDVDLPCKCLMHPCTATKSSIKMIWSTTKTLKVLQNTCYYVQRLPFRFHSTSCNACTVKHSATGASRTFSIPQFFSLPVPVQGGGRKSGWLPDSLPNYELSGSSVVTLEVWLPSAQSHQPAVATTNQTGKTIR